MKRFSQPYLNRAYLCSHTQSPPCLRLLDFIQRHRDKRSSTSFHKLNRATQHTDMWKQCSPTLAVPNKVDVSVIVNIFPGKKECFKSLDFVPGARETVQNPSRRLNTVNQLHITLVHSIVLTGCDYAYCFLCLLRLLLTRNSWNHRNTPPTTPLKRFKKSSWKARKQTIVRTIVG